MIEKRKICMLFNALIDANGVSRAAISIANLLAKKENVELTLIPIYKCSSSTLKRIDPKIKIKRVFGFYFHGFSKIADKIPLKLYSRILKLSQYDTVISFQYGIATKIVASTKLEKNMKKITWMHGYDNDLTLRKFYEKIGHVVCVSQANMKKLAKELDHQIKVDYCYNPINDKDVVKDGSDSIDIERPDSPLFISVGRHSIE